MWVDSGLRPKGPGKLSPRLNGANLRDFWDDLLPRSRDFGAGDNLTDRGSERRRLSEAEIKFEAIEPGECRLDAFLLEFVGEMFVVLA
jgi:hypothetical protein